MKSLSSKPFYMLDGDIVISKNRTGERFKISEIKSWQQVFVCVGVYDIIVEFTDDRTLRLNEHGAQLIDILKLRVPALEILWRCET